MMGLNDDYMFNQSGVIPYKTINNVLWVLLITSRKKEKWIFPKGIVEPELTPEQSAMEELFEEAGVSGIITSSAIGEYKTKKWDGVCTVTMFPLKVQKEFDEWPESDFRKRKWVKAEQAIKLISNKQLKTMVKKFAVFYKHKD
ncbi:MAG: NUDIX hydrolase [Chlorobi bacterium]|nr:NUDIX hydrolase [Chlorobiota bacterium]